MYPVADSSVNRRPVRNARLQLPQGKLFWRELGAGTPVLFLHDAWSDGTDWEFLLPNCPTGYHVLAPDLLGFGESDRPRQAYSIAGTVTTLVDWLNLVHLPPAIIVGHGLGGWIATTLASQHPDRVAALVLITPEGIIDSATRRRWRGDRGLIGLTLNLLTRLPGLAVAAKLLGQGKALQRLRAHQQKLRRSPAACQLLFRRRQAELAAEDVREQLPHLTHPTLLIHGHQDSELQIDQTQTFAQLVSQAEVKTVATTSQPQVLASSDQSAAAALWDWIQAR